MDYKVIDISKFNNITNFKQAASNVDGVIIRAGYRAFRTGQLMVDPKFKQYIEGFLSVGAKVGIYYFTTAINAAEGRQEAEFAVSLIKPYKISFPIFVDTEIADVKDKNGRSDKLTKGPRTEAVCAFCNRVRELGYEAGIYASDSWFVSQLDYNKVKPYKKWVASYSYAPKRVTNYTAWQYTSSGTIPGIAGRVDISHYYEEIGSSPKQEEKPKPVTEQTTPTNKISVKFGDTGALVKDLQMKLNKLGYKLVVDGEFGKNTKNAVIDFQKKYGLVVDGIAGTKTFGKINELINSKPALEVGVPVHLKETPLYSSSITPKITRKVTAEWYIAVTTLVAGRIRVKKDKSTNIVAGWVNWSDIKDQFR